LSSGNGRTFEANLRYYPVEMPYAKTETYVFSLIVPNGYSVDEMPKSEKMSLAANAGSFEYLIAQSGNTIQIKSTLKFAKAVFQANEYENLREFYTRVLKKQNEQIILKKKKS
jgi:hypothetical protein